MKGFKNFKETGDLKHIYKNELDMNVVINSIYDRHQRGFAIWSINFLAKKRLADLPTINVGVCVNEELAQELHKPAIKKFKIRRVYLRYKNIWAADLAKMGSLSFKNQGVKYLLCVIDIFTRYAWVKPVKEKKAKIVLNGFIKIVNKSNCRPNNLWFDQGREFCYSLMQ